MITEYAGGDQAATVTTEHFLSSPAVQGTFELTVDLNVMQAGDVVTLRAYKMAKAAGTQRVIWAKTFYGVQLTDAAVVQSAKVLNTLTDANAVRFSLLQDFGTSRTFTWQVHKDDALTPATTGRTLVVDGAGLADANTVKVGPTGAGTAQTAGDIMADTNDIQARLPAALVSGRMDSSVGAMAADVVTAASLAADAGAEIADAVLNRDMSTGTDSGSPTVRTPRQALRAIRNKVTRSGTALTVTKEDDSTASWTATLTLDATADPVTVVDPAS